MKTPGERLLDVAKRLDEMAGDEENELTTLSEELGQIEEAYERELRATPAPGPQHQHLTRLQRELIQFMERHALEIVGAKYAEHGMGDPRDQYMYLRVPNRDYGRYYRDQIFEEFANQPIMNPQATLKNVIV